FLASDKSAGESEVHYGSDVRSSISMLGNSHRPNEYGGPGLAQQLCKVEHSMPRHSRGALELFPLISGQARSQLVEPACVIADKPGIGPSIVDHLFDCARDEGAIAAGVNLKEFIGDPSAEQSAFGC